MMVPGQKMEDRYQAEKLWKIIYHPFEKSLIKKKIHQKIPQSFDIRFINLVSFLLSMINLPMLILLFKLTSLQEYSIILKYYIDEVFEFPLYLTPYYYIAIQ